MKKTKCVKFGAISPSKYLSFEFLARLRKNHYLSENTSKNTFKDYLPEEVDELYWIKAEKQAEAALIEADRLQREGEHYDKRRVQVFNNGAIVSNNR